MFKFWLNMFYYIVNEDYIKSIVIGLRLVGSNKVLTNKFSGGIIILKKLLCLHNTSFADINTHYLTTQFGKREKVSSFPTTYLKDFTFV